MQLPKKRARGPFRDIIQLSKRFQRTYHNESEVRSDWWQNSTTSGSCADEQDDLETAIDERVHTFSRLSLGHFLYRTDGKVYVSHAVWNSQIRSWQWPMASTGSAGREEHSSQGSKTVKRVESRELEYSFELRWPQCLDSRKRRRGVVGEQ